MPIKFESNGFVSNGRPFSSPSPSPPGENPVVKDWGEEDELTQSGDVEEEVVLEQPDEPPPPPPEPDPVQAVAELFFNLRDYIPQTEEEARAGDFVPLTSEEMEDYGIKEPESYATMYRLAPGYLGVSDKTGARYFRAIQNWYPPRYLQRGKELDYTPEAVAALKDYANCPPNQRKAYIRALRELYQRWREWYSNKHVALVHCPVEEGEVEEPEDSGELNQLRSQLEKSERGIDIYLGQKEAQLERAIENRVRQMAIRLKLKTADILNEELGINDQSESITSHERENIGISGDSISGREHLQGFPEGRADLYRAAGEYRSTDGYPEEQDHYLQRPWTFEPEDSEAEPDEWEGVYHHPEDSLPLN